MTLREIQSAIMRRAHKIARSVHRKGDNYSVTLGEAIRMAWDEHKARLAEKLSPLGEISLAPFIGGVLALALTIFLITPGMQIVLGFFLKFATCLGLGVGLGHLAFSDGFTAWLDGDVPRFGFASKFWRSI